MQDKRWLPTMDDYYESINYNLEIDTSNLTELKALICSKFNITPFTSDLFVQSFFKELATLMLRGHLVKINNFGSFFVSSPKTNNKKMIKFFFKPIKSLRDKINGR